MTTSAPSYRQGAYAGEDEWHTPARYIEAARAVLGAIDCDPASHVLAQKWIQAASEILHYRRQRPQTTLVWPVWLNPPCERGLLSAFVDKLMAELACGNVTAAILLVHSCTDTQWLHAAARASQAICFASGRIHFVAPCGDTAASTTHGQAFFYSGGDNEPFRPAFSEIGLVMRLS
jgi:DNA N-6-adenine-methyltransferase (Dam)